MAFIAALMIGTTQPAMALIIASGASNSTEASINAFDASFPYWRNVGMTEDASTNPAGGVYLGNQWVITAAHVNAVKITVTNSSNVTQTLNKDSGYVTIAPDLVMFHVDADPGLASVPIRSSALTTGLSMLAIGYGYARLPNEYSWRVDTDPTSWVWDSPAVYTGTPPTITSPWDGYTLGYQRDGSSLEIERWGTNVVAAVGISGSPSFPTLFASQFTDPLSGGTTHEMQGTFADSGGGVFIKNGSTWQLAGITHTVGNSYNNQPNVANNPMFGNATYFSDLNLYSSSILAQIPEPASLMLLLSGGTLVLARRSKRA